MRLLIIIGAIIPFLNKLEGKAAWDTFDKYHHLVKSQAKIDWKPCALDTDVTFDFREALYNITIKTFKKIAAVSNSHFAYSPYTLWMTLGAISEGTTGQTRQELWNYLLLPQDECLRNQQYHLATTLETADEDVNLSRSSMLILDDSVTLNNHWENFIQKDSIIQTNSAPIKSDPRQAANMIRKFLKVHLPAPNFDGNSVIVETLNYEGLWTHAFPNAITERAPFYDDDGKKIGYVDMMKIKRRVKAMYIPSMRAKVLEVPVGFGGRYKMLFSTSLGITNVRHSISAIMDSIFFDILEGLQESSIPIEVAIPRFRMTTEIDMRKILEELGVSSLWNDVEGTRNISDPGALPTSYIQRTSVTMDSTGIRAPIQEVTNIVPAAMTDSEHELDTGLDPILGRDFIIDRPFLFGLFDTKTLANIFGGTFSVPTYSL